MCLPNLGFASWAIKLMREDPPEADRARQVPIIGVLKQDSWCKNLRNRKLKIDS